MKILSFSKMMNQSERKVVFYEANAGKAEYFISKSSKDTKPCLCGW